MSDPSPYEGIPISQRPRPIEEWEDLLAFEREEAIRGFYLTPSPPPPAFMSDDEDEDDYIPISQRSPPIEEWKECKMSEEQQMFENPQSTPSPQPRPNPYPTPSTNSPRGLYAPTPTRPAISSRWTPITTLCPDTCHFCATATNSPSPSPSLDKGDAIDTHENETDYFAGSEASTEPTPTSPSVHHPLNPSHTHTHTFFSSVRYPPTPTSDSEAETVIQTTASAPRAPTTPPPRLQVRLPHTPPSTAAGAAASGRHFSSPYSRSRTRARGSEGSRRRRRRRMGSPRSGTRSEVDSTSNAEEPHCINIENVHFHMSANPASPSASPSSPGNGFSAFCEMGAGGMSVGGIGGMLGGILLKEAASLGGGWVRGRVGRWIGEAWGEGDVNGKAEDAGGGRG
ncbi:hypothetical protein K402DRAFT_17897 [Aulographum hederae CBS 113979]|uniref:Uncharacterized protein n=1 Tax=Aulographum hederae CBS 113979 TaxID=1176131 RepID=A0A6G1H6L0_9PEZI|nr:hypothetical protein K402DRAFT_17897 [Aulographum hederae CBS 113979]